MITRWKFGTVYFNGDPASPGATIPPTADIRSVSVGDTVPGDEIRWVLVNRLFIADRCILTGVSWDNLADSNVAVGHNGISIDGLLYRHWRKQFFWGQEAHGAGPDRVARGFTLPRNWNHWPASSRAAYIGWRPVLEPDTVQPEPELIGEKLLMRTNTGETIAGRLADITDYDFLLEDAVRVQAGGSRKTPAVKRWPGKRAAVEKDALVMAQQYVF